MAQAAETAQSRPAPPIAVFDGGGAVPMEENVHEQARLLSGLPFVKRIALMPDAHMGIGCSVGTVVGTEGAIIPAAVGVDIGCGMNAVKTGLRADELPVDLGRLRSLIERNVPHGRTDNGGRNDRGAWRDAPPPPEDAWAGLAEEWAAICETHPKLEKSRTLAHMGTLGTGNHFIEVCLDSDDQVWVMLHSGSRGVGNRIGTYFIDTAKKDMEEWFVPLPDADLSYLPEQSQHFRDYMRAVSWAQDFALANRRVMLGAALEALREFAGRGEPGVEGEAVNCHHNYVAREGKLWVTRKGAISAREGQMGVVPGSMGARSFIVRGKGNEAAMQSAPHGAGRRMSRAQARSTYTQDDLAAQTEGIECRKDGGVLDEIPGAYKDIDAVVAASSELFNVVTELRQIVCVKG